MPFIIGMKRQQSDPEWTPIDNMVFQHGQEASAWCKEENARHKRYESPIRYKVMPLNLEDPLAWKLREAKKLEDGTHIPVPWEQTMFEHVDPDDPTKVRFFRDDRDAHRNRYTNMAVGRFLNQYSYYNQTEIEAYCAKMGLDMEVSKLLLGKTADEIEHVYTNGPHSCMAYKMDSEKFFGGIHPVRVYGDLDLAVAYITRCGDITARCMVWPEKKIHGRIYGDSERLRLRLEEEGYHEDWNFEGARLHLVKGPDGVIVAPYVDGDDLNGTYDGDFIRLVVETGDVILKSPDGIIEADSCQRCSTEGVTLYYDSDYDGYVCCDDE